MSVEPTARPSSNTIHLPVQGNSIGVESLTGKYAPEKVRWLGGRVITLLFICVFFSAAAGYAGAFFRLSVMWANEVRALHPSLLFFLPMGGILITCLYKHFRIDSRNGFAIISEAVQTSKTIPSPSSPLIFFSTVITHLCGGSAGCEGASLLIGGGFGSQVSRWFKLNKSDTQLIVLCGMAAAFAPLLGTPVAAALFVIELTLSKSSKSFSVFRLITCMISAMVAFLAVLPLNLHPMKFLLPLPTYSLLLIGQVAVIAVLGSIAAWALCSGIDGISRTATKINHPILTIVFGSLIVVGITLVLGTDDYCGIGINGIGQALHGTASESAFFWKLLLTAITMGIGFKGGQIVPAFFIGATLGCCLANFMGMDPSLGAAIGLIAVFSGVVKCPFTAVVMSLEIFGFMALPLFAVACLISSLIRR